MVVLNDDIPQESGRTFSETVPCEEDSTGFPVPRGDPNPSVRTGGGCESGVRGGVVRYLVDTGTMGPKEESTTDSGGERRRVSTSSCSHGTQTRYEVAGLVVVLVALGEGTVREGPGLPVAPSVTKVGPASVGVGVVHSGKG